MNAAGTDYDASVAVPCVQGAAQKSACIGEEAGHCRTLSHLRQRDERCAGPHEAGREHMLTERSPRLAFSYWCESQGRPCDNPLICFILNLRTV